MVARGDQTVAAPPPGGASERASEATRPRAPQVELGLTVALLTLSAVYLARFLWVMAHEPLWGDEIWGVLNFSAEGPRASLTEVNNAVLPTFISSVLPGADSLDPLRARFLSMLAVVATPVLLGYELFRRRWMLPGALLVFLFSVNYQWLDRTLQARGYGILGFCAAAACVWLWRYLEEDDARWLVGVAIVSLVGIWTVPSFTFFALPLWVLTLATRRRLKVLLIAAAAGAAVLLVYAPLLGQLLDQTTGYADAFGNQFSSPVAVAETIGTYLLDLDRNPLLLLLWAVALVAPALVVLPERIVRRPFRGVRRRLAVAVPQPTRQLVRILVGAALALFAIALILTTPPTRTVAFVVVPLAVATVVSLGALRADPRLGQATTAFLTAAAVLACVHGVAAQLSFTYLPIQNWSGAADFIDETFPDGMPVFAVTQPVWLGAYLDTDAHPVVRTPDLRQLVDGELIVSDFDSTGRQIALSEEIRSSAPNLVEILIEQRGQGDRGYGWPDPPLPFPILVAPPLDPLVVEATFEGQPAAELLDRRLDTGRSSAPQDQLDAPAELVLRLPEGTRARSVVVAVEPERHPRDLEVTVVGPDGRRTRIPDGRVLRSPRSMTVALDDVEADEIVLTATRAEVPWAFRPLEAWVYPP